MDNNSNQKIEQRAKELQRSYIRRYLSQRPEKVKEYQRRYWTKLAIQSLQTESDSQKISAEKSGGTDKNCDIEQEPLSDFFVDCKRKNTLNRAVKTPHFSNQKGRGAK